MAMGLHEQLSWYSRIEFQPVDVLGVGHGQNALVRAPLDEAMRQGRIRPFESQEPVCHRVEGLRMFQQEVKAEDVLRMWQSELLQLRVQSGFWSAEVRDAGRDGDARPRHKDNSPEAPVPQPCHELFSGEGLLPLLGQLLLHHVYKVMMMMIFNVVNITETEF